MADLLFNLGAENKTPEKQRIIQEFVPGKQVTLAHVIANPVVDLYKKLGITSEHTGAIGILTITPSEAAIIAADVATKAAAVTIAFVDRFSGSVVVTGDVESVESSLKAVLDVLENTLHFTPAPITRS
jgi:ethanolamine utilization protein EutS